MENLTDLEQEYTTLIDMITLKKHKLQQVRDVEKQCKNLSIVYVLGMRGESGANNLQIEITFDDPGEVKRLKNTIFSILRDRKIKLLKAE